MLIFKYNKKIRDMKDVQGFLLVVLLMIGFILAAFGNLFGYGLVLALALTQTFLMIDKASK
jgi:hypothetical protein